MLACNSPATTIPAVNRTGSPMGMTFRSNLTRLFFAGILTLAQVATYADTFRPFNAANPTDPYGLDASGETVITSTGYNYHHWGVLLDETTTAESDVPYLSFTDLSTVNGGFRFSGTFPLIETDMFVNHGATTLGAFDSNLFSADFTSHLVAPTGATLAAGLHPALIRKYHFPTKLYRDTLSTANFDVGTPERIVTTGN